MGKKTSAGKSFYALITACNLKFNKNYNVEIGKRGIYSPSWLLVSKEMFHSTCTRGRYPLFAFMGVNVIIFLCILYL